MAAHKKRIVIVCHYYPPHMGGIELVAKNQAERLAALGNDVTVISSRITMQDPAGMQNGVRVVRVPAMNPLEKRGVPFPLFWPFTLTTTLLCYVRKADVVHVHDAMYISSFTAAVVARLLKKPVVLTQHVALIPHSQAVMNIQKIMHKTAGAPVYKKSRVVFTLNDRVKDHVLNLGTPAKRHQAAKNGVDTTLFHPPSEYEKMAARERFGLSHDKKVVLFVGRPVPKKGYDKVVAARSPQYQLVFAGGDRTIGDEPHMVFLGKLPQDQLAEAYRAADVFVLPSEGEGFPLSVQEAMASGLPVIMANDPGYARYNLDPNGVVLLDEATNVNVRKAIATLVNDDALRARMGAYSRKYAEDNFSWDTIVRKLDGIYDTLAGGNA